MKAGIVFTAFIAVFFMASAGLADDLLWFPESVVYDAAHERYLVSNFLTGDIVSIDLQGNQQYFVQSQCCQNGLHIIGNTVYAACQDQGVKAFDLDSGQLTAHIEINSATTLNDITSDTSGNIYVSDMNSHRIFKIRLSDHNYSTFVSSDISFPNGIYFQERYNRILLVTLRTYSAIQAVDVGDSSVVTIVNTGLHNLDGITEDNQGNIYFSSWGTRTVYRYDSTFVGSPQVFYENPGGPADIFYDKINCVLAVPLMDYNAVEFISTPTGVDEADYIGLPDEVSLEPVFPNPFNDQARIGFILDKPSQISLETFDVTGRLVAVLARGYYDRGEYFVNFDGSGLASGVFYVRLNSGNLVKTRKMVLLK
jgi:sugar lactone lactonase YvrE